MNKKFSLKFLIISLAATLTISFILPFNHIKADTGYTILQANTTYSLGQNSTLNYQFTQPVHAVRYSDSGTDYLVVTSDTSFQYKYASSGDNWSTYSPNTKIINGSTFYYKTFSNSSFNGSDYLNIETHSINSQREWVILGLTQDIQTEYEEYIEPFLSWVVGSNPYTITLSGNDPIYYFCNYSGSGTMYFYVVSKSQVSGTMIRGNTTVNIPFSNNETIVIDNETYYSTMYQGWSYGSSYEYGFPMNQISGSDWSSVFLNVGNMYAEQNGNINTPSDYGLLNTGFYTRFGVSGTSQTNPTFRENIDVITWDDVTKTGYDLSYKGVSVKIRAVPILWTALTQNQLDVLGFADAEPDLQYAVEYSPINFNDNQYEIRWGDLINDFQEAQPTFSYVSFMSNNAWYKNGWYYQIQYEYTPLEQGAATFTSGWQTITTGTSYSVSDSDKIEYNYHYQIQYGLDPNLYNAIQNVNNDNSTTNNWYIDNMTINMGDETTSGNKPWYEVLLESITAILNKIIEVIGGLFSDVIDGVLEFVHNFGIDFLGLFTDLIGHIADLFSSIDITDNQFNIPEAYTDDLNTYNTWTTGVFNVFFSSGLALFVLIPLILMIVRLVL